MKGYQFLTHHFWIRYKVKKDQSVYLIQKFLLNVWHSFHFYDAYMNKDLSKIAFMVRLSLSTF